MNFLETILNNPKDLHNVRVKDIDPITHDFDSESLSDRLHSLYSVLASDVRVDGIKVKSVLLKYRPELEFLKKVNKPTGSDIRSLYLKLVSELRYKEKIIKKEQ